MFLQIGETFAKVGNLGRLEVFNSLSCCFQEISYDKFEIDLHLISALISVQFSERVEGVDQGSIVKVIHTSLQLLKKILVLILVNYGQGFIL